MKIYKNLWAGYETYFIKTSQDRKYAYGYGLVCFNGKWELNKATYYISSLRDKEHYPIVGNINLKKIAIDSILKTLDIKDGR